MRIQKVIINKYKAFTGREEIPINGKNIFIYGENGSGKSSFYYALKDFFQSSIENIQMSNLRNIFLDDGGNDCSIEVEFDGNAKFILNETTKTTNTAAITDANRLKSFITYKHLLGVHNVKIGKEVNIFDLVVDGVLKHYKSEFVTGGIELSKLWKDVENESNKKYGKRQEFYFRRQKRASVERKAIPFNNALNKLFLKSEDNQEYLGPIVNNILSKLVPDLKIEFNRRTITVNQWGQISKPAITLQIESNHRLIRNNPQFILNEAKLSAIAISIFLGAIIKQSPFSPEIKPLFLDDILIGLDNENRLKILDLILEKNVAEENKVFKDFQIFITTYDRYWYEIAKLKLKDWKFIEFYKGENGPEIIFPEKSNLEKAKSYLKCYDFPACANALRKECENILKEKLPATYIISNSVKGLIKPPKLETLIDNLKLYYEDLGIQAPEKLIESLQLYKSILFNPMSHSDIESPIYKNDLENAFKVIEDLKNIDLPTKEILVEKGSHFKLELPAINYEADVQIAENIYKVDNNGEKSISPIKIMFRDWTRSNIRYAKDTGDTPEAYSQNERLERIKSQPYSIEEAVNSLNRTYRDRNVAEISTDDLLKNLKKDGTSLFDIIQT